MANETRSAQVEREDLVMFINGCFASTGQREFYSEEVAAPLELSFLHQYVHGNYPKLYARTLAAGLNHYNQAEVVFNLLACGAPADLEERKLQGELIFATLRALPPQRVYRLFARLRKARVNNRRTRAVIQRYIESRPDVFFDAVKYRSKVRKAVSHAHLPLRDERARYLFTSREGKAFAHPLLELCRQALYSQRACYELPHTVALGFAARHGIARETLLERNRDKLTVQERLRLQQSAKRSEVDLGGDLSRASLTQLASYLMSLHGKARDAKRELLEPAIEAAATRITRRAPRLGRIATVLDRSYSSSGSSEKARRPLAVAYAVHRVLQQAAEHYSAFWSQACQDDFHVTAQGQTDLARPLIAALRTNPELVVIVSDGVENAPNNGASEVLRVVRERMKEHRDVVVIHLNPAFDGSELEPTGLGRGIATVGLRDAESVMTALQFARFALGVATQAELVDYLGVRSRVLLSAGES